MVEPAELVEDRAEAEEVPETREVQAQVAIRMQSPGRAER